MKQATVTTEVQPHIALLRDLSKRCIERSDALGLKTKKQRNEMAMHYFCGAGMALSIAGQKELASSMTFWITAILAPRGWVAVEEEAGQ